MRRLIQNQNGLQAGLLALALIFAPSSGFSRPFRLAALVVNETLDLHGSNLLVDSFDSANTNWSFNGYYDPHKAKDNGDIFVGGSITNSFDLADANATIRGRVQIGPSGNADIGSLGGIGERSWQATNAPGQIQPGWLSYGKMETGPDIVVPYTNGIQPSAGYVDSVYFNQVLSNGDYFATSMSRSTYVTGHARLVLPNGLNLYANNYIVIAPTGSLTMYFGSNSVVGGNGILNLTRLARNLQIFCTTNVTSVDLRPGGEFTGVVLAPNAAVRVLSSGSGDASDFSGALVANSVELYGHLNIHFDETLIPAPARLGPPMWLDDGQLSCNVSGEPGFSYVVEASTDFSHWIPFTTNTSPFNFVDAMPTLPERYYRAVRDP